MRVALESKEYKLPDATKVGAYSQLINDHIDQAIGRYNNWSDIFKEFDDDLSGLLTFRELELSIRHRLKISLDVLPEVALKALWCVLDNDDSGYVEEKEFRRFIGREEEMSINLSDHQKRQRQMALEEREMQAARTDRELHLEGFIGSVQTWRMRAELADEGHLPPTKEEMTEFAVQFSRWVAAYLPDVHQGIAWVRVFNEVGKDNSGLLTFDQLKNVVRLKLKVSKQAFTDDELKVLWCALDEKDADSITQLDFGRFMKLAKGLFEHKAPKQFRHTSDVGEFHAHRDNTRSTRAVEELKERSNNTFLRQEVEAAGQALPTSDEVEALSRLFNTKMEAILGAGAKGWNRLFKDVDVDCSGLMTYDEFEQGIRQRLKLSLDEVSAVSLKALWCVLDGDDSGYIEQGEFQSFMQREVESTVTLDKRQQLLQNRARNQFAQYEAYVEREKLLDRHKSTVQTWKMRAELEAAGHPPLNDDAKRDLAVVFCKWLAAHDPADVTTAWLRLFRSVDSDSAGLLTYDELQRVVRSKFGITKKEFAETQLKMLWCAIDEDDSDTVQLVEFGRFVKRARGHFTRDESSATTPVAFRYAGEGPPATPGGQSLRVRRLPPYTYQGDPSRWELLPQWPRGPGTPRPQTAPDAATFASKMIKEEQEVPGRKIEMVRARERINALIFKAEEETKRPCTPRGCQGQANRGTKRWLPVVYKEFSDHNTRLRDVKENRNRLDSFVKEILDSTKSWSSRW
jgi:Ca2+-binding EF-hand superfamily protein